MWLGKLWKRRVEIGGVVVLGVWFLGLQSFGRWRIPQDGMFPSYPAGSHLWVRKGAYSSAADVRRGDVVVFRRQRADGPTDFVWRVVGLPKDRIAIRNDRLVVNGNDVPALPLGDRDGLKIFREGAGEGRYSIALPSETSEADSTFAEVEVPDGHFFVLGDNRHHAQDSRAMGPVAFEEIIGRVAW